MKTFNNLFTAMLIMLATTGTAWAQGGTVDYDQETAARRWYADRAKGILTRFEGLRHNKGQLPQKFGLFPYKQAEGLEYALVVGTWDERELIMFTPDGNNPTGQVITPNALPDELYWTNISDLTMSATPNLDITLKQRPLPVRNPNKAGNRFEVVVEGQEEINANEYNQMIFKPHQNRVRLAQQQPVKKTDSDGTVIKDEKHLFFSLIDPNVVAKMFRGYEDGEMTPWVVKSSFFTDHTLLQYSRWKEGEPVRKAGRDVLLAISSYYGGRQIKNSQWLATLESGERSFYAIQFEHQGSDALAGLVCMERGHVASVWEFHGNVDPATYKEGDAIWFVDDEGDFMPHAPEIHCIVSTRYGQELYIRLYGGESVQYYILREVGPMWMTLQTDYWVYVWD